MAIKICAGNVVQCCISSSRWLNLTAISRWPFTVSISTKTDGRQINLFSPLKPFGFLSKAQTSGGMHAWPYGGSTAGERCGRPRPNGEER